MDGVGLNVQADLRALVDVVRRLDHPLEAVDVNDDLIVHAHERDGRDRAAQHALFDGHDVHVLGTDDDVHVLVFGKALVHARERVARERHAEVLAHNAVDNVALADKIGHESILRLIINIERRADLLDLALGHDDDRVGHAQRFFLIVRDEHERDAGGLLDVFELLLHVLAQLQVERGERFVEQQHARTAHERTRNGDALLLSAGQTRDVAALEARELDEREHLVDLLLDLVARQLLLAQRKRHVFKHVQVGEEGVALKNGVDAALVRRNVVDALTEEENVALVRRFKAADHAQGRGFAAAGRAEQRQKFVVVNVEIDAVENGLAIKLLADVPEFNDFFHGCVSPFVHKKRRCRSAAAFVKRKHIPLGAQRPSAARAHRSQQNVVS